MRNWIISTMTVALISCSSAEKEQNKAFIDENVNHAKQQFASSIAAIDAKGGPLNPVTVRKDGSVYYCGYGDWRSGFFPGSLWYLYELTGEDSLKHLAGEYTDMIEKAKKLTWHHDVGFMVGCSYGNGYRLTKNPAYKDVMIEAAKSLSTRFRANPGVIQSWNVDRGWQSQRGWECPVIIDNMMNLELLFDATEFSGDSSFYHIAVSHADRTLEECFRPDGTCYHVVDYSITDGSVRNRHTAQGYAHESIWSRGQAWAIYGYAVCYRKTGQEKYLDQAIQTFEAMKNHPAMPEDLVPYWDMSAPNIPNEPRDASSAACIAAALYEMEEHKPNNGFKEYADKIMVSLGSDAYRAQVGTNGHFLLMHSVGSIPHNSEIDVPLNYADYYFMEALKRKKQLETSI